MRKGNYWARTMLRHATRRRVLMAGGAATFSAAFLAACGSSSNNNTAASSAPSGSSSPAVPSSVSGASAPTGSSGPSSGGGQSSSLITQPQDTTAQAKKGGALKFSVTADIPNFDPHYLSFADAQQVLLNYNRLTRVKPGHLETSDGSIIGDAAESWEYSPDKLTITIKIRNNLGMPDIAPVNGRNLDAEDIVYSWGRFAKNANNRMDYVNSINPNAPVLSLTAPDKNTIVVKLNSPVATIMSQFSSQASGQFFVFPKEAEDKFDLRHTPIGAGVYYMGDYQPSERFVYKRNPNYFDKNTAYADEIDVPIVGEYAVGLAQLRTGGLYTYTVRAEDILSVKKDVPDINLYQSDFAALGIAVFFGFKADPPENTPFRDVRVRQAYSMGLDRDLLVETFGNVKKFEDAGVPVETAWNTNGLGAWTYKGWFVDPKSSEFGENGKYFKHDITGAKQLLSAAGFPDGIEVISNQIGTLDYGPNYPKYIEVFDGMTSDAGFKFKKAIQDYKTNWSPGFRDSHGWFEGMAYRLIPGASDPGDQLYMYFNKGGSIYYGFDADGKGLTSNDPSSFVGDPTCNDLTDKMRTEFDDDKRKSMGIELQKYVGKQQYMIYYPGAATGFQLAWPKVRNWRVFQTGDWGQYWASLWVDASQKPS